MNRGLFLHPVIGFIIYQMNYKNNIISRSAHLLGLG